MATLSTQKLPSLDGMARGVAAATPMPKPVVTPQPGTVAPTNPGPYPAVDGEAGAPLRGTGGNGMPRPVITPANPFVTSTQGNVNQGTYQPTLDEASILDSYVNQLTSSNSALMRNARLSGIEAAAGAGLQNSTLAAGASQRAALDFVVPLAQTAMDTFNTRETRNWTAGQNQLDRDQQITMVKLQDWLNNESFMREWNANLAMYPITNTTALLNKITEQALQNPQVYTPDVISGLQQFFTTSYLDVLSKYFPSMYKQKGGK